MPVILKDLELHMGPHQAGGPDDLKAVIIDFINGTKKKLDIAVQELDDEDIARAVIQARMRKVKVRLILEGHYLVVGRAVKDPFISSGQYEENRKIVAAILRSNIDVKTDYNPKTFHQKFIIRDKEAVLMGSTNFTTTGTSRNLNHILIIRNKYIVKAYVKEFEEMSRGKFGKESDVEWGPPPCYSVSGLPVKVLFAPDHAPEMEIMKQMLKAKRRIDFGVFTFAQSSGIDDTMIVLAKSGIDIRGAMDSRQANQKWASTHPIHKAGVELYLLPEKKSANPKVLLQPRKLHHKLMVIDGSVIVAGSFNYTGPANYINDENILVIGDLDCADPEGRKNQKKLARYALKEIDRIIEEFGEICKVKVQKD